MILFKKLNIRWKGRILNKTQPPLSPPGTTPAIPFKILSLTLLRSWAILSKLPTRKSNNPSSSLIKFKPTSKFPIHSALNSKYWKNKSRPRKCSMASNRVMGKGKLKKLVTTRLAPSHLSFLPKTFDIYLMYFSFPSFFSLISFFLHSPQQKNIKFHFFLRRNKNQTYQITQFFINLLHLSLIFGASRFLLTKILIFL